MSKEAVGNFDDALQRYLPVGYAKLKTVDRQTSGNGGIKMQLQLPAMVRLVGKISGDDRVYVEDYVYTYLHELKSEDEKFPVRVALFGHVYQNEGRKFYMVYGAASVIDELANGRDEEQVRREFFEEYELIGYVNIYGNKHEWPALHLSHLPVHQ